MAYDPEARETGNSAMIIGIVALVLIVGGALAYFATRPGEEAPAPVVVGPSRTIINNPSPAPPAPPVVVQQPPVVVDRPVPVPGRDKTTIIERDTHTSTTREVPPPAPAPAPAEKSPPSSSSSTSVTVNVPPGTKEGGSTTTTESKTESSR